MSMDSALEYRVHQTELKVAKHHKDLYEGNGLPSITTRLTMLEDSVAKTARNTRTIVFLLLTAIIGAAADIITHHAR